MKYVQNVLYAITIFIIIVSFVHFFNTLNFLGMIGGFAYLFASQEFYETYLDDDQNLDEDQIFN